MESDFCGSRCNQIGVSQDTVGVPSGCKGATLFRGQMYSRASVLGVQISKGTCNPRFTYTGITPSPSTTQGVHIPKEKCTGGYDCSRIFVLPGKLTRGTDILEYVYLWYTFPRKTIYPPPTHPPSVHLSGAGALVRSHRSKPLKYCLCGCRKKMKYLEFKTYIQKNNMKT